MRVMMIGLIMGPVLGMMACAPVPVGPDRAEADFAVSLLNGMQAESIARNREFCGYIGRNRAGELVATKPAVGDAYSCRSTVPPRSWDVLASYHTHSAFDPRADSEVPSALDLRGDIAEKVNGYVSTPGGRVWFADWMAREVRILCDLGCVVTDPAFVVLPDDAVRRRFSLEALERRNGL